MDGTRSATLYSLCTVQYTEHAHTVIYIPWHGLHLYVEDQRKPYYLKQNSTVQSILIILVVATDSSFRIFPATI